MIDSFTDSTTPHISIHAPTQTRDALTEVRNCCIALGTKNWAFKRNEASAMLKGQLETRHLLDGYSMNAEARQKNIGAWKESASTLDDKTVESLSESCAVNIRPLTAGFLTTVRSIGDPTEESVDETMRGIKGAEPRLDIKHVKDFAELLADVSNVRYGSGGPPLAVGNMSNPTDAQAILTHLARYAVDLTEWLQKRYDSCQPEKPAAQAELSAAGSAMADYFSRLIDQHGAEPTVTGTRPTEGSLIAVESLQTALEEAMRGKTTKSLYDDDRNRLVNELWSLEHLIGVLKKSDEALAGLGSREGAVERGLSAEVESEVISLCAWTLKDMIKQKKRDHERGD